MRHPFQVVALSPNAQFLALAWANVLEVVDVRSGKRVFTSSSTAEGTKNHSHRPGFFIRHLVWHKEERLLSSAEDKVVKEWTVNQDGSLELLDEREMPKKVNAMQITPDGASYIIADKFGDVYAFPLSGHVSDLPAPPTATFANIASSTSTTTAAPADAARTLAIDPPAEGSREQRRQASLAGKRKKGDVKNPEWRHVDPRISTLAPVLGHVSLLTAVLVCSVKDGEGKEKELVVTADRDEHVRVSKWPQGWEIEGFLLGHRKFVSSLLIHPHRPSLLLSAGGDDHLRLWDLASPSYPCLSKNRISVAPLKGTAEVALTVDAPKPGKQQQRRLKKKAEKQAARAAESGTLAEEQDAGAAAPEGEEAGGEPENPAQGAKRPPAKTKKVQLAIRKMVWLGTGSSSGGGGGVLVISGVGSSALLVYPAEALLPDADPALLASVKTKTQLLRFEHPVLDITASEGSPLLWVSLDCASGSASAEESHSVLCYSLSPQDGQLTVSPAQPGLEVLRATCSAEVSDAHPYPKTEALYPEIATFSKDPAESRTADGGEEGEEAAQEEEMEEVRAEEERERAEKKTKVEA